MMSTLSAALASFPRRRESRYLGRNTGSKSSLISRPHRNGVSFHHLFSYQPIIFLQIGLIII